MASISEFVSEISAGSGLARTNRYGVIIGLPRVLQNIGYNNGSLSRVIIMCNSIELPSASILTSSTVSYVESREMPYKTDFNAIKATFYVDGDLIVKAFFDDWIKHIQNAKTRNFNYYDDYICPEMYILVEDLNDNAKYEVKLNEVYPKSVGAIGMSYADKQYMTLTVTLQFKNWTSKQLRLDSEVTPKEPSNDNSGMFDDEFSLGELVNDWNEQQRDYEQLLAQEYWDSLETDSPLEPTIPVN